MSEIHEVDIMVAGGGLVGAAFTCAMAQSGYQLALVEPQFPAAPLPDDPFDLRVSALTRASQRSLASLGVWAKLPSARLGVFEQMHVWEQSGFGEIHFNALDVAEDVMGYIVENRLLNHALIAELRSLGTDRVHCLQRRLAGFRVLEHGVQVQLEDGSEWHCRLLVGADGIRSAVRQQAGIEVVGKGYDQQAVVATVQPERCHEKTAWQRFLTDGPLAFLPLPDNYCSIVWSTSPQHAQTLCQLPTVEFERELSAAYEQRLGAVRLCSERVSFPLQWQHAKHYVQPRVALIGDAAHSVHPLAGQGVNLGLLDAMSLAQLLDDARRRDHRADPGRLALLRRYERWRKGDNLAMQWALDGLHKLFSHRSGPLPWLRNAGLNFTARLTPVKHSILRRAMGLEGDLPRRAQAPLPEQLL